MDLTRVVKIEQSTSTDDWLQIRECFVHSFRHYPLYKYMVPEESKRDEFLRAYLDANYEVTVGSGQGILLAVKIPADDNFASIPNETAATPSKVIGGVVFLPPSNDGCGWAIGSDEPYWQAYEKYGLAKVSKTGFERVLRYEAWENENVAQKASRTKIPLWNGLFCAISPKYSSKGLGTTVYKEAIRIMASYWDENHVAVKAKSTISIAESVRQEKNGSKPSNQLQQESSFLDKIVRNLFFKNLHIFSLLSHRQLPQPVIVQTKDSKINLKPKLTSAQAKTQSTDTMHMTSAPLVVAISHSDRAAHFHQANGFLPVLRIPFYDEVENITPFYTHVLILDPFRTGKLDEISSGLQAHVNEEDIKTSSHAHFNNLMIAQRDPLILQ
ncbi:uncharacterized protein LOC143461102 [Clavelina lepadiformis]|uniref:uncharacterized protein LOC143461102 n=1 Tax=Clavelina lepadiformis TaxID=159417 RepID=UPI0040432373